MGLSFEQRGEITINHNVPVTDMIKAGNYNGIDRWFSMLQFPERNIERNIGIQKYEWQIATSSDEIDDQKIALELQIGFFRQLAGLRLLLGIGSTIPTLQIGMPILALGSAIDMGNAENVPYLVGGKFKGQTYRHLRLGIRGDDWPKGIRFLTCKRIS